MFGRIDTSEDHRIDFGEFKQCLGELRKWGVEVSDAEASFAETDEDGTNASGCGVSVILICDCFRSRVCVVR